MKVFNYLGQIIDLVHHKMKLFGSTVESVPRPIVFFFSFCISDACHLPARQPVCRSGQRENYWTTKWKGGVSQPRSLNPRKGNFPPAHERGRLCSVPLIWCQQSGKLSIQPCTKATARWPGVWGRGQGKVTAWKMKLVKWKESQEWVRLVTHKSIPIQEMA